MSVTSSEEVETVNSALGISSQKVKNSSELISEVAQQLNLSEAEVSSVVSGYTTECVRLVGRGSSYFLSDMYFAKVSEIGSSNAKIHEIVPHGAMLRLVAQQVRVPYFTIQSVIDTLLKLCVHYAKQGYSARVSSLVTFKPNKNGGLKVSYGLGVKTTKLNKNLRVSIKPLVTA